MTEHWHWDRHMYRHWRNDYVRCRSRQNFIHQRHHRHGSIQRQPPANLGVVKAQVGDWVLVHAGLVIQVLSESQAQEINNLLAELETLL